LVKLPSAAEHTVKLMKKYGVADGCRFRYRAGLLSFFRSNAEKIIRYVPIAGLHCY